MLFKETVHIATLKNLIIIDWNKRYGASSRM